MSKKNFIGFAIFLLVLLSVSSTTGFAWSYDLTNSDIDVLVTKITGSSGSWTNSLRTKAKQSLLTLQYNYDTIVIACDHYSNYNQLQMYGFNSADVVEVYNSSNINYMGVDLGNNTGTRYYLSLNPNNSTTSVSTTTASSFTNFGTGGQNRTKYLVISNDLGNNLFSGPWQSSEWLVFGEPPGSSFSVAVVYGISGDYEINFNGNVIDDLYLIDKYNYNGIYTKNGFYGLIDETTLDTVDMVVVDYYKYNLFTKRWVSYNQVSFNTFSGDNFYYDSEYDVLVFFDNQIGDTLELVTFVPNSVLPSAEPVQFIFYWQSSLTQFSGNSISPDGTFSNPYYYNDYNNQIDSEMNNTDSDKIISNQNENTQQIINTLDNDDQDDEYLGHLSEYTSGDYDTIADKFGFYNMPSDIFNDIYIFLTSFFTSIMDDSDVYFDFSLHGENPVRIYSSDIYVPNGVLKSFITVFLVACTVYVIYLKFFHYFELLSTGNIKEVVDEIDIDKSIFRM